MSRPLALCWAITSLAALAAAWASAGPACAETRAPPDAVDTCKNAADKQVVIDSCSIVIAMAHDPRLLERAYNRRGLANEATGQFDGAVNDYSQVIRLNPKIAGYFDNRMRAYKALGQLDLALKDEDTAVSMAPGYSFVFQGRGAVHFDRGEYPQAVADFTSALGIEGANAGLLVHRGRAFMKLGQTNDAIRDFSEAHEVKPDFAPALRERGLAWAQYGDAGAARPDLEAALAANPADDEVATALRSLDGAAPAPTSTQPQTQADPSPDTKTAIERLKEERVARARAEAQRLRGEAGDFVKSNRDDPKLMDHLQRIADLGTIMSGNEPAPIERATSLLSADLASDPIYTAYKESRDVEKKREDQRNLAVAISTLKVQRGFLIGEVVKNPTGDDAPVFLPLVKQADAVLAAPELARAQTVIGSVDAAIARAKITDRYEEARRAAPADKATP